MATAPSWKIQPLGDRCLIVEFGTRVDPEVNLAARTFAERVAAERIAAVLDIVPAFTTVAIHYRPEALADPASEGLPYVRLNRLVEALLRKGFTPKRGAARIVEIPVCYGGTQGPDLEEVAAARKLAPAEVIELHAASPHQVYMVGFAPGLPYIGGLDKRLAMPRRATPRVKIPPGTVAIAADQSVIYPLKTPGGWNLIGRTPLAVFTPDTDPPCLLRAGDQVRFVPITPERFRALAG